MKTLLILSALFFQTKIWAADLQTDLHVQIQNIRNTTGFVLVSLHNNESSFPNDNSKAVVNLKLTVEQAKNFIIEKLAEGEYALAVAYDENGNGEVDKNGLGIPSEGFGFSNNAMGTFGPPAFKKAKFQVKPPKTNHVITLKYM